MKNIKNYNKIFELFFLIFICFSFFSNVAIATEAGVWNYTETLPNKTNKTHGPFDTKELCVKDLFLIKVIVTNSMSTFTECTSSTDTTSYQFLDKNAVNYIAPNKTTGPTDVYTLLAPIGEFKTAPKDIGDYFNTIFLIAIGLCGALAVIMIVIGGIQYMGDESIFGKTEAKSKITSAILGLLIALGAYALLNTINPDLLGKGGVHIKQVSAEIDPEIHGDLPQQPTNGKYCNGKYTPNQVWPESIISTDQTVRTFLTSKGITVNKNACTKVGEQNCTSVAGLDTSKVIALKDKCGGANCTVEITGGTECWLHSNKTLHLPGSNIVDLSFNSSPSLKSYVETGITPQQSNMGFPIYTKDNIKFMKETNHYHIINW